MIPDLLESAVDALSWRFWATGAARQTGAYKRDVTVARKGHVNFPLHSQGNLLTRAGVHHTDWSDWHSMRLNESVIDAPTYVSYGSPVNNSSMHSVLHEHYFTLSGSFSNSGDIVAEIFGGNRGNYAGDPRTLSDSYVPLYQRPIMFFPSTIRFVFDPSSHAYACQVNCGDHQ